MTIHISEAIVAEDVIYDVHTKYFGVGYIALDLGVDFGTFIDILQNKYKCLPLTHRADLISFKTKYDAERAKEWIETIELANSLAKNN